MLGAGNMFYSLIAAGTLGFRDQAGDNDHLRIDIQALLAQSFPHLPFQGTHLVEYVNHLATGIRPAQDIRLTKPAMRRKNRQRKYHRDTTEKTLQVIRRGGFQNIQQ